VKITEEKGIRIGWLTHSTSKVELHVKALGWGLG